MGLVRAGIAGRSGADASWYRPGAELDTAAGIDYKGFSLGRARISPLAQVIFSERTSDCGSNASPDDTGYQRHHAFAGD